MPLRFALHIGKFAWPGGGPQLAEDLRRVGAAAEEAGFDATRRRSPSRSCRRPR